MIRRALPQDMKGVERLIRAQHAASKYAERVGISDKAMETLLLGMFAQMGQRGPNATHVAVAVEDGAIVGFVAGVLDRVYHIGDRLTANDLFLVSSGKLSNTLGLIDSYLAWARANPKVVEVVLSWSDALAGAERVAEIYRRKGFVRSGEMYELRLDAAAEEIAA